MYASLSYINTHHTASPISNQPFQTAQSQNDANDGGATLHTTTAATAETTNPNTPLPLNPEDTAADEADFAAALRELSRDLVLKEQQIEVIISRLPGIGTSRGEQERRIRALEEEGGRVDEEVRQAGRVKAELVRRVEGAILGVRRP